MRNGSTSRTRGGQPLSRTEPSLAQSTALSQFDRSCPTNCVRYGGSSQVMPHCSVPSPALLPHLHVLNEMPIGSPRTELARKCDTHVQSSTQIVQTTSCSLGYVLAFAMVPSPTAHRVFLKRC